ncbi:tyrosine-protein phosphatase non-receptor type 4 isoform X7 [Ursus americanus]|uniref:tyrosine-protein phosphatase non-receptor type 4 isoform X7 n=1 Tax=Ursus americanus TaxID=9643 RepID=UPI001E67DA93|nr:tyrosine-protein phosphatase non-receptor type 4 isoform X7 [Ursus americanus]
MTSRFRLPAGRTYNVRASELARDRQHTEVVCNILLLDNTVQAFKVNKHDQGQVLLDIVFKHLDLTERDYFGLQLADDSTDNPSYLFVFQRWLDPNKPIRKQLKKLLLLILGGSPYSLNFRVKFFVSDPNKLQEEYTRYQYFLQIKQDILTGRLPCPYNTAALLASFAVQSELGDYNQSENLPGYLSDYSFIPNQPQDFEKEIAKLHQQHTGLSPAEAEFNYLNTARTLELYGVEFHYARDQSNNEIMIGVMSGGILIYKNRVRMNTFPWLKIVKISFKCKQFFVQLRKEVHESRETLLGFNMVNYRACKNLWKACVEHHTFFRLDRPLPPQKNFFAHYFTLGSKFRYCFYFFLKEQSLRDNSKFGEVLVNFASGVLKRSMKASFLSATCGRTEVQSVQYGKEKANKDRIFASRNSAFTQEGTRLRPSSVGHLVDHVVHTSPSEVFVNHRSPSSTQANSIVLESSPSQETPGDGQPPALPPKQSKKNSWNQIHYSHSQQDLENHINETFDIPSSSEKSTPNGGIPQDNLVLIRMKPDENGRFGFNVKGGYDQKMPVIVSRVAPGTPADLCVPRLNEGDQVVLINGRDIAEHTHDQVVLFIKASCERHSGELVLLVRPNAVYDVVEEKLENEPDFQYIPEKAPLDSVHQDDHSLRESMIQLAEGLITGTVLTQFDQLYRKKPGMTMSCAKLPQNISKNRYRDISPYDATRVILKGNEDYINANYINMEIPSSSIINQYIACQGPLPHTCTDFWQMTWEQGSSMVVMLTTQVERGRVKCHQYWPEPTGSSSYGCYQVTCHSEEGNTAYIFRKMTLFNQEKNESRQLTQIQYIAWPDHGVPDDSSDFLDFVGHVRNKRAGKEEPIVVHCSAGIGRTGVLITMETAMCLIECNQPVYPLDIVRTMRDQRAMMIQTPSQYRFVCEAILKVYEEGFVKPLTTSSNK